MSDLDDPPLPIPQKPRFSNKYYYSILFCILIALVACSFQVYRCALCNKPSASGLDKEDEFSCSELRAKVRKHQREMLEMEAEFLRVTSADRWRKDEEERVYGFVDLPDASLDEIIDTLKSAQIFLNYSSLFNVTCSALDEDLLTLVSKKKQLLDFRRPLSRHEVKQLEAKLMTDLIYHSNALEGNTLTRGETEMVLGGLVVRNHSLRELLEVVNLKAATLYTNRIMSLHPCNLTMDHILKIHELILHCIDENNAGQFRSVKVAIAGHRLIFPHPLEVPALMEHFNRWLHGTSCSLDMQPVLLACQVHFFLTRIHPFVDGNGRTARLLMNLILMHFGYPPVLVRCEWRDAYLDTLRSADEGEDLSDFTNFILSEMDFMLDIYLNATRPIRGVASYCKETCHRKFFGETEVKQEQQCPKHKRTSKARWGYQ
eukprot:gnl/Trimastix_PCT/3795.p1 GENE.gnl/Trimastix_PCT/3795~~gnl/Trimastix_PCT/3795.p1  ORF type:complete len:444 (+),score=76.21 gnl/Trimastix_PCT/3795:45-1334(+)